MRTFALLAAGFICCLPTNCAWAQQAEDAVQVFQKVEPSVVALESIAGSGTGILIDKSGHILTNAHVVALPLGFKCLIEAEIEGQRKTVVYKSVKVLGVHSKLDLALVKIDSSEHDVHLVPATLLKKKAETGQRVYAIGNPGMEGGVHLRKTITEGLLSGVDRLIAEVPHYQFSAAINPGNSGGPLCDRSGNVIGLVTLKRSGLEGVGFAIPLDTLKRDDFRLLTERKGDPLTAAQHIAYADAIMSGFDRIDPEIMKTKPIENLLATALQAYREALLADPANPKAYTAIGEILTTSRSFEAAEAHLVSALEIAPWGRDSRHYRAYGALKLAQQLPRDAEIIWLEGVAKHPKDSRQIWEDLAALYRDEKQWSQFALCANMAVVVSMAFPEHLKGGMPNIQMAMESMAHVNTSGRSRGSAQIRELPLDLTRQILHRNALLRSKRLVITKEFGELVSRKNIGLSDSLLAATAEVELPAGGKVHDLLGATDAAKSSVVDRWAVANGIWTSPETVQTGLGLSAEFPAEFDLIVEVERIAGQGELVIAVPCQEQKVMFVVDFGGSKSGIAGASTGIHTSPVLLADTLVSLSVRVRKDVFAVSANGREIYSRATSDGLPAAPGTWQIPSTASAFIGAKTARFRVHGCWVIASRSTARNPKPASTSDQQVETRQPDGVTVDPPRSLTSSEPKLANTGEVEARQIGRIPTRGRNVKSIAFSPDKKLLALGTSDDGLTVVEVPSGRRLFSAADLSDLGDIKCLVFTPQGDKLLSAGGTGKIAVWNVTMEGQLTQSRPFIGHSQEVLAIDVSRDGKFAISGGSDRRVRYWDIETGREQFTFDGFGRDVRGVRFSEDGTHAWASDAKVVLRLDLMSGEKSEIMQPDLIGREVAFSADGSLFSGCSQSDKQRIWKMGEANEYRCLEADDTIGCAVFSPDAAWMFTGGRGSISVWRVAAQRRVGLIPVASSHAATLIAISNDGKLIATIDGARGREVHVFEVEIANSD